MKIYKTSEFAKKIGVHPRTLQRWDRDGLLVAHRTPTNLRYYTEEQLQKYCKQSQRERYITELCEKCGTGYVLKIFDLERCIYKNLGNGYDIEISCISNRYKNAVIYVWLNDGNGYTIVESIYDIPHNELPNKLPDVERRYSNG